MNILQVVIGVLSAVGLGFILADVFRTPSIKALKAANNLGKQESKKVNIVEVYLKDLSSLLSRKLKLNEYKRAQLEADLKTAGMGMTPEAYVADALTKAFTVGVLAIPLFFILKIVAFTVLAFAVASYFKEYKAVSIKIKSQRDKIEYELPRFVGAIEKTLKHSRDVIYIIESYRDSAGAELSKELEITAADMRSGNGEVALTRLESRVGSTMMSDVTRGLVSVIRGDDTRVYFASLIMKFSDYQRQLLKQQANAVPRRVRKLSMALLFCFILIYVAVIGQVLLSSISGMF